MAHVGGADLSLLTPIGQDTFVLAGFSGTEEISRLFNIKLELLAENNKDVALDRLIGQPAAVELALPTGGSRLFNGIVHRVSQGARSARFTSYHAEVVPQFWLLTRRQRSRIFERQTVPEIVRLVLGDLVEVELHLEGTQEARDYCVQYRESDFAFASRLMEEEGIYYFFRHDAQGHTLVLANTPTGHPDVPGPRTVVFDPTGSERIAGQAVFSWEKTQELRSGKIVLWDYNFQIPGNSLEGQATIRESVLAGQVTHALRVAGNEALEVYDYPGGYAQRFDGIGPAGQEQPEELQKIFPAAQRSAALRVEHEALASLTVEGASNCRQFTSGHRFTLGKHVNADGTYVLTSVTHTARLHDPQASDRGLAYENHFTCIPEALPYRPRRITPKPVIGGVQPAVVVRPTDAGIYPDKYGRVKVKFAWDREGKSSCWIRVAQPYSTSGSGTFWLPEVDDEVLVGFEEGDPDRPYVLGSLFNPRRLPPASRPPTEP